MVAVIVHKHKNQKIKINSIQSTHFNQSGCTPRQKAVYLIGHITQINIDTEEQQRGNVPSSRTIKF